MFQEWALRNPPAYWALNVRWVVVETWVTRFNYEWVTQLGIYRLNGTVKPTLAYASR